MEAKLKQGIAKFQPAIELLLLQPLPFSFYIYIYLKWPFGPHAGLYIAV